LIVSCGTRKTTSYIEPAAPQSAQGVHTLRRHRPPGGVTISRAMRVAPCALTRTGQINVALVIENNRNKTFDSDYVGLP
jgi:hypothetical protein